MKLILVRHGETEENKNKIIQGWIPGTLTEAGKKQARLAAERLKHAHIDYIYTSDLKRCIDTTQELAKHHPRVKQIQDKRLRERSVGIFEGKKYSDADWTRFPGELHLQKVTNGESFAEVLERLKAFLSDIVKKHQGKTVLVSTHGGPIRLLVGFLTGKTLKQTMDTDYIKNTAVTEFDFDSKGNAKAVCINCDKHLH